MNLVLCGDALEMLKTLPDESVQCCVTSPPYWGLRDYGVKGQLGLEKTPEEYVQKLVEVFREVKRVLRDDGVLWLNLADSYAGSGGDYNEGGSKEGQPKRKNAFRPGNPDKNGGVSNRNGIGRVNNLKPKDLVGIPWMVAFALRADGWWLRSDIIWSKPNPMPESVTDRPTKAHEYIFLLTKSSKYYYDAEAIKEEGAQNKWGKYSNPKYGAGTNGKMQSAKDLTKDEYLERYLRVNKRSVWEMNTQPRPEAHFATFPDEIPEICIKAGSKKGDMVLDPFGGRGTTAEVAKRLGRDYIIIDLNPKYVKELIEPSLEKINPLFQ